MSVTNKSSLLSNEHAIPTSKEITFLSLFVLQNLALFGYAGMNSCGKVILSHRDDNQGVTLWEYSLFRSIFLTVASWFFVRKSPAEQRWQVPDQHRKWLVWRSLVGFTTFFLLTIPLSLIPLSVFQAVLSTTPFWIAIISLCVLSKRIEGYKWLTMLVAYCGILITCTSNPAKAGKY